MSRRQNPKVKVQRFPTVSKTICQPDHEGEHFSSHGHAHHSLTSVRFVLSIWKRQFEICIKGEVKNKQRIWMYLPAKKGHFHMPPCQDLFNNSKFTRVCLNLQLLILSCNFLQCFIITGFCSMNTQSKSHKPCLPTVQTETIDRQMI